jgi:curved DNA-binding protein CbpA/ribosomal protein L12E/L44/L45/RPP1/RPP2
MYPSPAAILAKPEGAIAETPLPLLVQAIFSEQRTVALELKLRGLEKKIQFEDGSPVACRSNLLHETLGKTLVNKGKVTEAQYQKALGESVQTGQRMGELLVSQKLISPFDLYKVMQANLALKILDAFRWHDATWRLVEETEPAELALRVNPAQLVLTGVTGFLTFDVVAQGLAFTDDQRFGLVPAPPHAWKGLKLSTRDSKLVQVLRARPTLDELMQRTGLDVEEAMRRLYALTVLGFVAFAEALPAEAPRAPPPAAPAPVVPQGASAAAAAPQAAPAGPELEEEAPEETGATVLEETDELKNLLLGAYLNHRTQDPFDLLGIPEKADAVVARKAFLDLADRFCPLRFRSPDMREKADALLAARARALGELSLPEQATLWRKRRAAALEKARGASRPTTQEQFRIKTDLLDASTQFAEASRRLEAGSYRGALEHFQFATDIEPSGVNRAHLAWARYLVDPQRNARLVLGELAGLQKQEPGCNRAWYFAGEIQRALGQYAEAEESFKRAYKADLGDKKSQQLAVDMMRARREGN